jgi:hypothetical protein
MPKLLAPGRRRRRRATRRSNWGCSSSIWPAPGRARTLQRIVEWCGLRPSLISPVPAGPRRRRPVQVANDEYFRRGNRLAAGNVALNTAWGDLVPREVRSAERAQVVSGRAEGGRNDVAAQVGLARVAAEGNPPAAKEALEKGAQDQSQLRACHPARRSLALDDRNRTTRRRQ